MTTNIIMKNLRETLTRTIHRHTAELQAVDRRMDVLKERLDGQRRGTAM